MFPLIIDTIPENGSENISRDTFIKVMFDESLLGSETSNDSVNESNVKLSNYTIGKDVDAEITLEDGGTTILVKPSSRLEAFTEYRLTMSGLESPYGEKMFGTFEMRFTTIGGSIEEVLSDPEDYMSFEVVMTSPKDNSVGTPSKIKIRCSDEINPSTDKTGIMLIEDRIVNSIDEAIFLGENLLTESNISVEGDTLVITPPTLESGKKYLVIVSNVTNNDMSNIVPYMFSFYSSFKYFYGSTIVIKEMSGVKNILSEYSDYEIAYKIFENSELARFISKEASTIENIDWNGPDIFVSKYVEAKTKYDILLSKIIEISSNATSKQLDDLNIQYGQSLSDLLSLVDKLKLEYEYWENYLRDKKSLKAAPGAFVKGENADDIPDYKSRMFKDWDGSKSW